MEQVLSTITFIKIIPRMGIRHRCTKIRRSRLCGWPSMLCAERRDEDFFKENDHCLSILVLLSSHEWAAPTSPVATWEVTTHTWSLKVNWERCTTFRGEPWRQVAIKASRGKTKLHYKSRLLARMHW
jgi:hypothetical protein